MRLRRLLSLGGAVVLVLLVFTIDVIRKNVELDVGGLSLLRDFMVIGAFACVFIFLDMSWVRRDQGPMKKLGLAMIAVIVVIVAALALSAMVGEGFDSKNLVLMPLDYPTLFVATLISVICGVFAVLIVRLLSDLVLYKRKRGTRRNFLIFIILMLAASVSTLFLRPLDSSVFVSILVGLAVALAVINSFRLSWIVYLTKREKMFSLIYGFFLFAGFITLNILTASSSTINKSLLYYSYPLKQVVSLACIFGNAYFGMAFISTLFHLPTAEAFDRKTTEVSSLHNLSRLVTQVFNFDELVDTVTLMTLQVCEANTCWLEIIQRSEDVRKESAEKRGGFTFASHGGEYQIWVAGMKHIARAEIDALLPPNERTLRDTVLEDRKPVVVDEIARDPRFKHFKKGKTSFGSLVVVPLVSHHAGLIGILYATKESEYGFFKDDVELISAFADQAAIAIDNSRLINKSIERERLLRELNLAQEMQKKLLPQSLPVLPTLDIDAISTPAFEVGGDYYDIVQLDDERLGVVVGDVSGKGVSAAFYMSEVKGIFQSLSRLYPSPRDFMIRANEALAGSIDKHSFVSLMYAIVNTRSGRLTLSRAGHCPLLHVSGDQVEYVRPTGMGLGLTRGPAFAEAIEERTIDLHTGDVCVFYTDGVTEARCGDDEFGYERLISTVLRVKERSAGEMKHEILETVRMHIEQQANEDDQTLVVLKWRGGETGTKVFS